MGTCTVSYAGWNYVGKPHGNWSTGINIGENWNDALMMIKNALVYKCKASYCWESGFHMELDTKKYNVMYQECTANYNGQKKVSNINTNGLGVTYCAGFLISTNGVKLIKCSSNYNTGYGYRGTGSPILIGCTGIGNGFSLFTNGCDLR